MRVRGERVKGRRLATCALLALAFVVAAVGVTLLYAYNNWGVALILVSVSLVVFTIRSIQRILAWALLGSLCLLLAWRFLTYDEASHWWAAPAAVAAAGFLTLATRQAARQRAR